MKVELVLAALASLPSLGAARHAHQHAGKALRSHRHSHSHGHGQHHRGGHHSDGNAQLLTKEDEVALARKFSDVEDDWRFDAGLMLACQERMINPSRCKSIPGAFLDACTAVGTRFIEMNGGHTHRLGKFMEAVCSDASMQNDAWKQSTCVNMTIALVGAKIQSDNDNTDVQSNLKEMCGALWTSMLELPQPHPDHHQAKAAAHASTAKKHHAPLHQATDVEGNLNYAAALARKHHGSQHRAKSAPVQKVDNTPSASPKCANHANIDTDCGYPGISKDQCEAKGCCYDPKSRSKWCFPVAGRAAVLKVRKQSAALAKPTDSPQTQVARRDLRLHPSDKPAIAGHHHAKPTTLVVGGELVVAQQAAAVSALSAAADNATQLVVPAMPVQQVAQAPPAQAAPQGAPAAETQGVALASPGVEAARVAAQTETPPPANKKLAVVSTRSSVGQSAHGADKHASGTGQERAKVIAHTSFHKDDGARQRSNDAEESSGSSDKSSKKDSKDDDSDVDDDSDDENDTDAEEDDDDNNMAKGNATAMLNKESVKQGDADHDDDQVDDKDEDSDK